MFTLLENTFTITETEPFKRQINVFGHFMGLVLKGLNRKVIKCTRAFIAYLATFLFKDS